LGNVIGLPTGALALVDDDIGASGSEERESEEEQECAHDGKVELFGNSAIGLPQYLGCKYLLPGSG